MRKQNTEEQVIESGSFFTMDTINQISTMTDLDKAKVLAEHVVEESTAKPNNKAKALAAIRNATSVNTLTIMMGNFFLAHPSEGLGTIQLQ